MENTIYAVIGYQEECEGSGECYPYNYGVFSSEEKANEIKKNLESAKNRTPREVFEVKEIELDKPTDLYYVSI